MSHSQISTSQPSDCIHMQACSTPSYGASIKHHSPVSFSNITSRLVASNDTFTVSFRSNSNSLPALMFCAPFSQFPLQEIMHSLALLRWLERENLWFRAYYLLATPNPYQVLTANPVILSFHERDSRRGLLKRAITSWLWGVFLVRVAFCFVSSMVISSCFNTELHSNRKGWNA